MHSNIYIFGCSHSAGTSHKGTNLPFPRIIANELNISEIFDYSQNSAGNEFLRKSLITAFLNEEIRKNSLILFQLTDYHRKSFELLDKRSDDEFKLEGNWGKIDNIIHILPGMFNRDDDNNDDAFTQFSDTYGARLSGEHYIMFDDIFSTYSILKLISSTIKNVDFQMIAWGDVKPPFDRYIPNELSNIMDWSLKNKLTENDIHNNGDLHLSQEGHEKLAEKILKFL